MSNRSKLLAEGLLTALGSISPPLVNLALIPLLTKNLTVAEYGTLSLILVYASFLAVVIGEPNTRAFGRYFAQAETADQSRAYIAAFFVSTARIIALTAVVLTFCYHAVPDEVVGLAFGDLPGSLLALSFALAVCTCTSSFIYTYLNTARRRASATLQKVAESSTRLMAIYAVSLFQVLTPAIVAIFFATSSLISGIISWTLAREKLAQQRPTPDAIRHSNLKLRQYARPFYVWTILLSVKSVVDRLVVLEATSTEGVAQFTAILQIGFFPFLAFSSFFFAFYSPIAFRNRPEETNGTVGDALQKLLRFVAKSVLAFSAIPVLTAIFFGDIIVTLLTSADYAIYSHFLAMMIISGSIMSSAQVIEIRLLADSSLSSLTLSKSLVYIVGILANIVLTLNFALLGAFISNLLFSCFYLTWVLHTLRTAQQGRLSQVD